MSGSLVNVWYGGRIVVWLARPLLLFAGALGELEFPASEPSTGWFGP